MASVQIFPHAGVLRLLAEQYEQADDVTEEEKDLEREELEEGEKASQAFVSELGAYESIAKDIKFLEACSKEIWIAKEELDHVFNEETKNKIISSVESKLKRSRAVSRKLKVCTSLGFEHWYMLVLSAFCKPQTVLTEELKREMENKNAEVKEEGSIRVSIRENLYNYYLKKYFLAHKNYSVLANNFKSQVRSRAKRELQFIDESMTDDYAEELIDKGMDQQFIQVFFILYQTHVNDYALSVQTRRGSARAPPTDGSI